MWLGLTITVLAGATCGWLLRDRLATESEDYFHRLVEISQKERDAAKLQVKKLTVKIRSVEERLRALAPGDGSGLPALPKPGRRGLVVLGADSVARLLTDQEEDEVDATVITPGKPSVRIMEDSSPPAVAAQTGARSSPRLPVPTTGVIPSISSKGHSLNDLGDIPTEALKLLRGMGVHNTTDLRNYFKAASEPGELASALGLELRKVRRWRVLVNFLEIPDVSPENAWLLEIAGLGSLDELAKQDPHELGAWMAGLNEDQGLALSVPAVDVVAAWVGWCLERSEGYRRSTRATPRSDNLVGSIGVKGLAAD